MPHVPDLEGRVWTEQARALRGLARALLGGDADADDVVQDAWLTARGRAPREERALSAWWHRAVRHLALRRRRDRLRRAQHRERLPSAADVEPPDAVLARVELQRDVSDAVLALPEPYRTAVVLRFWDALPPRAIAARLGVPVATVKTRLQRGLALLRARLAQRHGRASWAAALLPLARSGPPALTAPAATLLLWMLPMKAPKLLALATVVAAAAFVVRWPRPDAAARGAGASPAADAAPIAADDADPPAARAPAGARVAVSPSPDVVPAITGRVVDDATGLPVGRAQVTLEHVHPAGEPAPRHTETGRDGRFALPTPLRAPGVVAYELLTVTAAGHAELVVEVLGSVHAEAFAAGDFDLGELRLVRGVAVRGRVVGPDGGAVSAPLRLFAFDGALPTAQAALLGARSVGRTAPDGSFALAHRLGPARLGPWYLAAAGAAGVGWTRFTIVAGQHELEPLEIALQPNGALRVRVLDADGRPVAGAAVTAAPHYLPIGYRPSYDERRTHPPFVPPWPELQELLARRTDADGEALFAALPLPAGIAARDENRHAGPLISALVGARADGHRAAVARAWPSPAPAVPTVTLRLVHARTAIAIAGRVVTREGRAVPGVRVGGSHWPVQAISDEQGRYALAPHDYGSADEIGFRLEGGGIVRAFAAVELPSDADAATLAHDFVVDRCAPIEGQLLDQHGQPIAGAQLTLGKEGGVFYPGKPPVTGDDGRFCFPDAAPGAQVLAITPPEPRWSWSYPWQTTLHGGTRDAVVVLHRRAGPLLTLRALVRDGETKAPVGPARALLRPRRGLSRDPWMPIIPLQCALGAVTAAGVPPGDYELEADVEGYARAVQRVTLDAASHSEHVLEVFRHGAIEGTVHFDGLPADVRASLRSLLVLLAPNDESAYAVDEKGVPVPSVTPNTARVLPGRCETFRLERVSSRTPVRLWIAHEPLFAEVWCTIPPGGVARVDVWPVVGGTLAFRWAHAPANGTLEIELRRPDGTWYAAATKRVAAGGAGLEVELRRAPGPQPWRLRSWRDDRDAPAFERSGVTDVETGGPTVVELD